MIFKIKIQGNEILFPTWTQKEKKKKIIPHLTHLCPPKFELNMEEGQRARDYYLFV